MQLKLVTDNPQPAPSFDVFWKAYPRKVVKGQARKAFLGALRKTDLATMLVGIEAYKRNKPSYCDYCHPATWLNGERWDDEYETGDEIADALEQGLAKWRRENEHG